MKEKPNGFYKLIEIMIINGIWPCYLTRKSDFRSKSLTSGSLCS